MSVIMRSMMESFERWSINGEPDAPRDASPVPREDCRNLCPKGIRRCFPTLLCRRVLLFLVGGWHGQQSSNARSAKRRVSGESGFCRAAADVYGRHMGFLPSVSCGYGNADSAGQRRYRREQRKGSAIQPWHLLFRFAPQHRYGRADLPCAGLMR